MDYTTLARRRYKMRWAVGIGIATMGVSIGVPVGLRVHKEQVNQQAYNSAKAKMDEWTSNYKILQNTFLKLDSELKEQLSNAKAKGTEEIDTLQEQIKTLETKYNSETKSIQDKMNEYKENALNEFDGKLQSLNNEISNAVKYYDDAMKIYEEEFDGVEHKIQSEQLKLMGIENINEEDKYTRDILQRVFNYKGDKEPAIKIPLKEEGGKVYSIKLNDLQKRISRKYHITFIGIVPAEATKTIYRYSPTSIWRGLPKASSKYYDDQHAISLKWCQWTIMPSSVVIGFNGELTYYDLV